MRTFWLHPISGTVGTVISLIAQRFISFNSSSQDGGESKPRNHRLASETQGLQWLATPRSTDGSKKWWTDWCFLFFQNGWYQIRWHHMTRIHNNLKIEFGDFVNISALLSCACRARSPSSLAKGGGGAFSVSGARLMQRPCATWHARNSSLAFAHETFQHAIPETRDRSMWKRTMHQLWFETHDTVDGSETGNNHLECMKP